MKILFVIPGFQHGGTNKSLLNLLKLSENSGYEPHILSLSSEGPYRESFQPFNVVETNAAVASLTSFGVEFHKSSAIRKIKLLFWKFVQKFLLNKPSKIYRLVAKTLDFSSYDVVVAAQEGAVTELVSYANCEQRVAWIRCDYSSYLKYAKVDDESHIYQNFRSIICVSKYTADVFAKYYPQFVDRVNAIYEPMDSETIIRLSLEDIEDSKFDSSAFTLLSIGRIHPVKRFSLIPQIARKMIDEGCTFKWYIIGSGGAEEQLLKQEIDSNNVGDCGVMLGEKNNPYPYIKFSDVLVCTSSSEACPNVVNEAKILNIPVVAADFHTAKEYIVDGKNGYIKPIEKIADALISLCNDSDICNALKREASNFKYKNEEIIAAICKVLLGEN